MIRDHPIGRGTFLPTYIAQNQVIAALDRNHLTGKPYEDNLCFFRCLALHNGCHTKNLERDKQYYYQQYQDAGLGKKKFHGIKISELNKLEKICEVNIQVHKLGPTQTHSEDDGDQEILPRFLLHSSVDHTAILQARCTSTSTRTIFPILKISPGTQIPFVVPVVEMSAS